MPLHQLVTTCRKGGGPLSKSCMCEHCCLAVCAVCGSWEGSLTTDCPGTGVNYDRRQEVYETSLDYTDDRGWHLAATRDRSPRFQSAEVTVDPPPVDPRGVVAPSIDWARVDRTLDLQHDLARRAIAWVLADRACEDSAAADRLAHDKVDHLRSKQQIDAHDRELLADLERTKIDFQRACRRVECCDDELRQAARRLVSELE